MILQMTEHFANSFNGHSSMHGDETTGNKSSLAWEPSDPDKRQQSIKETADRAGEQRVTMDPNNGPQKTTGHTRLYGSIVEIIEKRANKTY